MVYTIAERVELVSLFYKNNDCARAAARAFNNNHPENHVSHPYIIELMRKFVDTGSVQNKKREANQPQRNENVQIAILGHIAIDNMMSTRTLSDVSGVTRTTLQRILKMHKFHPYKIHLVQQLNEDDGDRRLQFCETMSEM